MTWGKVASVACCAVMMTGCVSPATQKATLAELEEARKASARAAGEVESVKGQAAAQIEAVEAEQVRLGKELIAAHRRTEQAQADLESIQYHLSNEQASRRRAEEELAKLQDEYGELEQGRSDLQRKGRLLQAKVEDLTRRLDTARQELAARDTSLREAQARMAALGREEARLSGELLGAQNTVTQTRSVLTATEERLLAQQQGRQEAERAVAALHEKAQQLERLGAEIRRERDGVQTRVEDLTRRLETTQQELAGNKQALGDAHARISDLVRGREQAVSALTDARNQGRMLESSLAAEQAKVTALQDDKQRLLSGTTTAQEEIGRLQKRAGELETVAARVEELDTQLRQRDREIGKLREAAADRETLTAKLSALTDELGQAKRRVDTLTGELAALSDEASQIRQAREELTARAQTQEDTIQAQELALALAKEGHGVLQARLDSQAGRLEAAEMERDRLRVEHTARESDIKLLTQSQAELASYLGAKDEERIRLERERAAREAEIRRMTAAQAELAKSLQEQEADLERVAQERRSQEAEIELLSLAKRELMESLEAQKAEKARLEQEKAAKDREIRRLTQTHAQLRKSFEKEIAKGDIQIQQIRDRLRINMVDRILFDSGRARVKPAGLEVLKRVGDVLKNVPDKQIRIEGHTDDVPIGPKIIHRFPTNWELSTARATSVVRYLVDKGGVGEANLAAVGYADNRPVASNDTSEGRAGNRRIEIVLYPKDLSEIGSF